MGKKRRIMTSGMKFIKKYRSWLEKAGDPLTDPAGDADVVDVPGMDPFISALEVTPAANRTFTFKCLVDGNVVDGTKLEVTLNGTVLPLIDNVTDVDDFAGPTTVDGQTQTKGAIGEAVNLDADGHNSKIVVSAANTPAILAVGKNTIKVAVDTNNKKRFTKTVTIRDQADSLVTIADHANLAVDADGAGAGKQLNINIIAGGPVAGNAPGDAQVWLNARNKFKYTVAAADGTLQELKDAGVRTLSGDGNTIATVDAGGNEAQTNVCENALAAGDYTVTITPISVKGVEAAPTIKVVTIA